MSITKKIESIFRDKKKPRKDSNENSSNPSAIDENQSSIVCDNRDIKTNQMHNSFCDIGSLKEFPKTVKRENTFQNKSLENLEQHKVIEQLVINDRDLQEKKIKETDNDLGLCMICIANSPNILFSPCNHGGICEVCF